MDEHAAEPKVHAKIPRTECLFAAAGIVLLIVAAIAGTRSAVLLTRPAWLDEIYTLLIVTDPSTRHAMSSLAGGVESHPPALHLILRTYAAVTGRASVVDFRVLSSVSVVLAMLGVYLLCRRHAPPSAAAAGALVIWTQSVVIENTFEIRFYGPLLAASVWFAYTLVKARREANVWNRYGLAAVAVLLCTIHYFGVLSLAVVWGFDFLANRGQSRADWKATWPALFGPLALAACIPLYLQQKRSTSVPTWVPSARSSEVLPFLGSFVPFVALQMVIGLAVLSVIVHRLRRKPITGIGSGLGLRHAWQDYAGLTGLAVIPLVLAGMSFAVQPVMQSRYAIAASAAFAPFVALLLSHVWRSLRWLACGVLIALSVQPLRLERDRKTMFGRYVADIAAEVRSLPGDGPAVFELPHDLMPVYWKYPELRGRLLLLDVDPRIRSQGYRTARNFGLFVRDQARIDSRFYGLPRLISVEQLFQGLHFYWFDDGLERGLFDPLLAKDHFSVTGTHRLCTTIVARPEGQK